MNYVLIGFPKSATKTIDRAFRSIGYNGFHQNWRDGQGHRKNVAVWMYRGYDERDNPFEYFKPVGPYAITECDMTHFGNNIVLWPQLDYDLLEIGLERNIDVSYILNYREPYSLLDSFTRWKDGDFRDRITRANLPGLPSGVGSNDDDLIMWFINHFETCRERFDKYPHRFIEVNIESDDCREQLEQFVGTEFQWWGRENVNDQV